MRVRILTLSLPHFQAVGIVNICLIYLRYNSRSNGGDRETLRVLPHGTLWFLWP